MSETKLKELEDKLNKTMSILAEYIGIIQSLENQVKELTKANTLLLDTIISGIKKSNTEILDKTVVDTQFEFPEQREPSRPLSDLINDIEPSKDDILRDKIQKVADMVLKYGKTIEYLNR